MNIEITHTYKFEVNGTTIVLTQDQARQLYNALNKEFGNQNTFPPLVRDMWKGPYTAGDIMLTNGVTNE